MIAHGFNRSIELCTKRKIAAIELRIASTFHASRGILLVEGGGNTVGCDDTSDMPLC